MTSIDKEIRAARPRLKDAAPLTSAIVVLFAWLNLLLGLGFIFDLAHPVNLIIVNDFLTLQFWGHLFFFLGSVMMFAHIMNDWNMIKVLLVIGMLLKSFWSYALIIRVFEGQSGNVLLLVIWFFITGVQFYTYVYFIPEKTVGKK